VLPVHTIIDGKCSCGKDNCPSAGKHPATANGVKDASTDSDQIQRWFGNGRPWNIGIAAGADSKLAILDIDPKNGGTETVKQYKIPRTLEVITGSGGRHYYFADPEGTVKNSAGKLGEGLDVRGTNGYVVAPPSLHLSGNEYRWAIDPGAIELAGLPRWMNGSGQKSAVRSQNTDDGPIKEGQRNEKMCSIAGSMRRQGCDEEAIHAALININQRRCEPPMEYDELRRIARSVAQYPVEQDGTVLNDDHPETLAAAFHNAAGQRYRYNSIDGWSILDDNQYRRLEDDGEVAVTLRRFLNEVYIRKLIRGQWQQVRFKKNGSKVRDILAELGAMEGVHIPADKHAPASLTGSLKPKNIIAMNNCLLNIKSLPAKCEPLTKDFYTLNYLPFDHDPAATCPKWTAFLESVFTKRQLSKKTEWDNEAKEFVEKYEHAPDDLAIEILGEWFGYLLTQDTHLQKIFALIGDRRSGKSTIGKVLRALNGPVNTASPTLTSLATEFGLQGMMNKTVAIIGDANTAGRSGQTASAVERLKSISGEDGQQINRKNKDYVEVSKLPVRFVLIANKMQDLRDSTGALASRFCFLVTTQTFLGREDHHLESKLLTELPGIFNWAMDGLKRMRKRGYIKDHPTGIECRDDF
jgi:putative DNA primase/helicase